MERGEEETDSREEEWLRNWTPLAVDYGEYDPLRAGSIDGTGSTPHDHGIVRAMQANCNSISSTSIFLSLSLSLTHTHTYTHTHFHSLCLSPLSLSLFLTLSCCR